MHSSPHRRSGLTLGSLIEQVADGTHETPGTGRPAPTGFSPLDDVFEGGFLAHELVLLGGLPAAGKTLCALQWARSMAGEGRSVVFACFEHDETALLARLLSQELASLDGIDPTDRVRARKDARKLMLGAASLDELHTRAVLQHALQSLYEGAPQLRLVRASGAFTTASSLAQICTENAEPGGVLFVDYLQKLPVPGASSVDERIHRATEELKDLATSLDLTVVALASASEDGFGDGRLQLSGLRGAASLAHEADIALVLNDKARAASRRHLDFDLTKLDAARDRSVISIEKNRRGEADLHLEFRKDFANYRLDPAGSFMAENVADERRVS